MSKSRLSGHKEEQLPYGTGSYPEPPHGLQRRIRQMARTMPFMGPCFINACRAYSEHVGVKRQLAGV